MKHNIRSQHLMKFAFTSIACVALALAAPAAQRPLSDFTSRQGTYCLQLDAAGENLDCAASGYYSDPDCFLFTPPIRNQFGFYDPAANVFGIVDYAGLADAWSGGAFQTSISGSVNERPLADGRAEVSVVLQSRHALTWAIEGLDFGGAPTIFGHRAQDVVNGAAPAFGDMTLQVTFINTAPGALLPDLIQLFNCPDPGQQPTGLSMTVRASGSLADGTPARLYTEQRGLLAIPAQSPTYDAFPVEKVHIIPTGQ